MNPLPGARIVKPVFLGVLWGGTFISSCFVVFRIIVRIKYFRKVFVDDILVIGAWSMLLGTAVLWQIEVTHLYNMYAVRPGQKSSYLEFFEQNMAFLRIFAPVTILFYSCLWSIKLSFLFFFRRLGAELVRFYRVWWWCAMVATIVTWIACIADINYRCALGSPKELTSYCLTLPSIEYSHRMFYANCAIDVLTDCFILLIPIMILWNVQIPLGKKLVLIGIFSVTVVVIIVSIIRVAVVEPSLQTSTGDIDVTWLYLWSNLEMITAIIVACIASFRQLYLHKQNQSLPRSEFVRPADSRIDSWKWPPVHDRSELTPISMRSQVGWPTERLDS